MTLAEKQAADFVKIHERMGSPMLEWNGEDYRCIPASKASMKGLKVGGMDGEADFLGKVFKADFGDGPFPEALQPVTYAGTDYEIGKVKLNESGVFYVLACIESPE